MYIWSFCCLESYMLYLPKRDCVSVYVCVCWGEVPCFQWGEGGHNG